MPGIYWASWRFKEGCSTVKDYSKLNKQFVLIDMYDGREDYDVAAGVAVPAECTEGFARAVEELAAERFGGASFSELLDNDLDDDSMNASAKKSLEDQIGRVLAPAKRINPLIRDGRRACPL